MTGQQLRNSILQEAIQGRLVPNVLEPGEKTGAELLRDILTKRQKKENDEKGKKAKKLTLSIIEEEPYDLPDGWCWCKIGDLADIERGGNFTKSDFVEKGYPCIHYGQIHMRFGPRTYSVLSYLPNELAAKQRKAHSGDIVMAVTSENIEDVCKCTAWLGKSDVAIGAHTAIIRHYIDPVFLVYFFKSSLFYSQKKDLGHGSKVVEVTPVSLNNITLPLPPLSIQKAIVEKIEELFPLLDEYEKASVELNTLNDLLPDKLRKSILQEAIHGNLVSNDIPDGEATAPELLQQILKERQDRENKEKGKKAKNLTLSTIEEEPWELPEGWCWCKLGDVISLLSGRDLEPNKYNSVNNGIPYITGASNFDKGSIIINRWTPCPVSVSTFGDLLITCKGTVGGLAFNTIGNIHIARQIMAISAIIVDPNYIQVFLMAKVNDLNAQANGVIPGISREDILFADFPLPPLSIQHRIVEKIEEVFAAINQLQA